MSIPMRRVLLALIFILSLAIVARADVQLKIDLGWDGVYRAGRWTPVVVTVWDPAEIRGRNVVLELSSPHDDSHVMAISTAFAVTASPRAITLYCPLSYQLEETIAVVRDLNSFRKLAEQSLDTSGLNGGPRRATVSSVSYASSTDDIVLGVSGPHTALGLLAGRFKWTDDVGNETFRLHTLRIGYLPTRALPEAVVGYDGLDALVLNAPDLGILSDATQQTIARWVRAGGRLLVWPSDAPVPSTSAIAALLPAAVGENRQIELSVAETKTFGLAPRVAKVSARQLTPNAGARHTSILGGKADVYMDRAGFGCVALVSIDASQLVFDDEAAAGRFWRPILKDLLQVPDETPVSGNTAYNPSGDANEMQQAAAMEAVVDRLGDVPGVGKFDFGYIALVLIVLMFVVGPVDWLVLKKLGRQPWTWLTMSGWIVLLTVGALYIGHLVRSGDLHYRSVRLIEQADDRVVATTDVVGLYSPKTADYLLTSGPDQWWEPAGVAPSRFYRASHAPTRVDTVQDSRGNRLAPMNINIWSLRFVRGELGDASSVGPVIGAKLHRQAGRIVGTITNLSSAPLHNVRVRLDSGMAVILPDLGGVIPPGLTINADAPIAAEPAQPQAEAMHYYARRYGNDIPSQRLFSGEDGFLRATCALAGARSRRIDEILQSSGNVACLYAESEILVAPTKLTGAANLTPKEKHWQLVRAVFELK